jgi:FAD/FMN-containing dehydrogenase
LIAGATGALWTQRALPASALVATTQANRSLAALQKSIQGVVIPKGSADYGRTRQAMVWNKRVSQVRSPDAIVQVASTQDVVAAVRFARANGLKVAVRGSGHNYHGAVLRDGGLLLDLSRLKAINIDAQHRRASVQPAVKGGDFAAALAPHGLAFPVGHCSDVGLSGYILNGGFGWNVGEWGPACMSVTGIEMVTAAGNLVYADEKHNADLLWAARGAGPGFFAVATRYDVVLQPLRPAIQTCALTFDLQSAAHVAKWLSPAIRSVHPTVEVVCTLGPIDATGTPVIVVSAVAFASSQAEASARIAPLKSPPAGATLIGEPIDQPSTFKDILQLTDAGFPGNKRMAGDQLWSEAPLGDLIVAVQHLAPGGPPAPSAITLVSLGGGAQPSLIPPPGKAALSKGGGSFIGAYAFWDDPAQDNASRAWVHSAIRAAEPYGAGNYIGEADLSVSPSRARDCFSGPAWDRLVALRRRFDPDNLFFSYLTDA